MNRKRFIVFLWAVLFVPIAYLLGLRRRRPVLPAHSYVEKVEYWAVVWGTFVMAATGIMLWANTLILAWMPKLALDIALAVHFYEAVLATLAIVVWHFYMVLFDPLVYPMDPAWITGYSVRRRAGEGISGETPYDIPGSTEPGCGGADGNRGEGPSP